MINFDPNAYFKQLAIEHVDIKHTEDKPAFFREYSTLKILFNNSDFLDKMKLAKRTGLVSQFNEDGSITGPNADNKIRVFTGAIYIITRIIEKDKGEAFIFTNIILKDIIARMQKDLDENNIPITMKLNDIPIRSLDEVADGYYGHMAMLAYTESAECYEYNADKWT